MNTYKHEGVWGIQNNVVYWADTVTQLKFSPESFDLSPFITNSLITDDVSIYIRPHGPEAMILVLDNTKQSELPEEYTMLQFLLKTVVISLAPKVAPKIVDLLSDGVSAAVTTATRILGVDPGKASESVEKRKKSSDTTKLTQYMLDFIIYTHSDWRNFNEANPRNKKTMEELVDTINTYMGTNKSRTSLARVWNGHIDRDSLPIGKAYFDYPRAE